VTADQSRNAGVLVLESLRLVSQPHTVVDRTPVISGIPRAALVSGAGVRYDGGSVMPIPHKGETPEDFRVRRLAYELSYRESHRELLRERTRNYRATHVEQEKQYLRTRYESNKERSKAEQYAWRRSNAEKVRGKQQAYRLANPQVHLAQLAVERAIKRGQLVPPAVCSACLNPTSPASDGHRTIQAHHYLGYAPNYQLDVVWLCCRCHKQAERAKKEGT
jgi:hypothetical protein